jgi:hypothetical protein
VDKENPLERFFNRHDVEAFKKEFDDEKKEEESKEDIKESSEDSFVVRGFDVAEQDPDGPRLPEQGLRWMLNIRKARTSIYI